MNCVDFNSCVVHSSMILELGSSRTLSIYTQLSLAVLPTAKCTLQQAETWLPEVLLLYLILLQKSLKVVRQVVLYSFRSNVQFCNVVLNKRQMIRWSLAADA